MSIVKFHTLHGIAFHLMVNTHSNNFLNPKIRGKMNPRFSNLAVAIVSLTVVALAERIASVIKVGMAGYPPVPPPASQATYTRYTKEVDEGTPGSDIEETPEA